LQNLRLPQYLGELSLKQRLLPAGMPELQASSAPQYLPFPQYLAALVETHILSFVQNALSLQRLPSLQTRGAESLMQRALPGGLLLSQTESESQKRPLPQ
jgi:hypothetical protein